MADHDDYDGPTRPQSVEDQDLTIDTLEEFSALQTNRATIAGHCEEVATLIAPQFRNTFFYGNYNIEGVKKADRQLDSNGQIAHSRFVAIADSLLTPRNAFWHGLEATDEYVNKDRDTQLWFEHATKVMFAERYRDASGFYNANQGIWGSLGAWGTGSMFVDKLFSITGEMGLSYLPCSFGQIFLKTNHQGRVDGCIRWFQLTARQCMTMFGWVPPSLRGAYKNRSEMKYDFLHRVYPRYDYDPDRMDAKGKPWLSCYVCPSSMCMMQDQGGYSSFPFPTGRYELMPGEVYGRSPAMMVLGALKTLNDTKRIFLKQGHRAAEPPLLTHAQGLLSPDLRPGATNIGGMSEDGRPLVGTIPVGDINITKEMMDEEKGIVRDAFLTSLFEVLTEHPNMTATQVIQIVNEKGMLVAPTLGRQADYLGMLIEREMDVLQQLRKLPPMPQRLKEAKGAYKVRYSSPLFKMMEAGEVAGFLQMVQELRDLYAITQDRSIFYPINFTAAVPDMARIRGVRASWMSSPKEIQAKAAADAKQQQQQQQIQAMPAQAGMMGAQAKMMQARQQTQAPQ